jgi:hypothetical protein
MDELHSTGVLRVVIIRSRVPMEVWGGGARRNHPAYQPCLVINDVKDGDRDARCQQLSATSLFSTAEPLACH